MRKLVYVLGASLILASCGGGDSKTGDGKSSSSSESKKDEAKKVDNLLLDPAALQKAEDELKALPQFGGKEVNVFQSVEFKRNEIVIAIQDPNNPDNIDQYYYREGKWTSPTPIQISGGGNMKDNVTPLKDIKFATAATVAKNYLEKAVTVEGAKQEITWVDFRLIVHTGKRKWATTSIEDARSEYNIEYNMDGSVKDFKKR